MNAHRTQKHNICPRLHLIIYFIFCNSINLILIFCLMTYKKIIFKYIKPIYKRKLMRNFDKKIDVFKAVHLMRSFCLANLFFLFVQTSTFWISYKILPNICQASSLLTKLQLPLRNNLKTHDLAKLS